VYRIDRDRALVQTVDFFTPIVDDPFAYGQIAAANALSDVYAMGGRPLTALNLLGVPTDKVPIPVINAILRGGAAKIKEAGCVLVGGQSMRSPEPFYGLAVTGLVSPRKLITNVDAQPGDLLVLTKPLGTGIITTGIKRGVTSAATVRKAVAVMSQLNEVGALLAERGLIRAGTDVTGFGLLGHLGLLCRESGLGAEIFVGQIPVVSAEVWDLIAHDCIPGGSRQNLETANEMTQWIGVTDAQKALVSDAQTSGGLLLCVPVKRLQAVRKALQESRAVCAAVVGRIVRAARPRLRVSS